jgi:hypothetical protein
MRAPPAAGWIEDHFKSFRRAYYLAAQSAAATYGSNPHPVKGTQVMTEKAGYEITLSRIRGFAFREPRR